MNRNYVLSGAVIVVLLVGTGWAMGLFEEAKPDPAVVEAVRMREEAMTNLDPKNMKSWKEQFGGLREKVRHFSKEQRRSFHESGRKFFMQKVDGLLAMPPEEQRAEADKWIDFMSSLRKSRQAGGEGPGGRPGEGNRGAQMSQAERDQWRKQRLDKSTPEMRAKMDQVKDIINQRLEERGMEPIKGPGHWR